MTLIEKLKYMPKKGDVLVYLDGSYKTVEDEPFKTHVKLSTGKAVPLAHIRDDLIRGQCYVCKKTDKNCP